VAIQGQKELDLIGQGKAYKQDDPDHPGYVKSLVPVVDSTKKMLDAGEPPKDDSKVAPKAHS